MPRWAPSQMWRGEDVYVIGGGDSLRSFDWELLRSRKTIGCNGAYKHGAAICKITLFADLDWWEAFGYEGTKGYGGLVVSVEPKLLHSDCPWLLHMDRHPQGLHKEKLVWCGNTGAAAVNLALILGAARVFLLGFDMKLGEHGKANWHDDRHEPANPHVYPRFIREFHKIKNTLDVVFPGREIINVTDDSQLNLFPKVGLKEHFQEAA